MPRRGVLRVATCQFPVSAHIRRNAAWVCRQIQQARRRGADIVHFPEAALSGYAGVDVPTWKGYDWETLKDETRRICALVRELRIWVVLGSAHRLTGRHKPHNSLYLIDPRGRIADRYDKRFCTSGDLKHYTPGDHFVVFEVNGMRCGLLICYDTRFPEIYRACKRLGVQCMFHSFYNARAKGRTVHTAIMRPTLQAHAGINYMWISGTNASGYYQLWPSIFIQPDGAIAQSLRFHRAGVMVNRVDTRKSFNDASAPFRSRAMRGILHSGRLVSDPRSRERQSL